MFFSKSWASKNHYCFHSECPIRKGRKEIESYELVAMYKEANISLKKCGGCYAVFYCSQACLKDSWRSGHNVECKAFQNSIIGGQMSAHAPVMKTTDDRLVSGKSAGSLMKGNLNLGSKEMTTTYLILCRLISMRVVKQKDYFATKNRHLPPPLPDKNGQVNCYIQYIPQGGYENEKKFLNVANEFSRWIADESQAGKDFGDLESEGYFHPIIEALFMLEELQPTESNNWRAISGESKILITLVTAAAIQKCYTISILNPKHPLHMCITLLGNYVDWKGPVDHAWNDTMFELYRALLAGINFTETMYNCPIEPTQLQVFHPIANRILQQFILINPVCKLEGFSYYYNYHTTGCGSSGGAGKGSSSSSSGIIISTTTGTANAEDVVAGKFLEWCMKDKLRGILYLNSVLAQSKVLFPDLDTTPLFPMVLHYETEINKFLSLNRSHSQSVAEIRTLALQLSFIKTICGITTDDAIRRVMDGFNKQQHG